MRVIYFILSLSIVLQFFSQNPIGGLAVYAERPLVKSTAKVNTNTNDENSGDSDDDGSEDGSGDFDSGDDSGDYPDDWDEVYEAKILVALDDHATKHHLLLERALKEGGASSETIEIGPDGNIGNNIDEELWHTEFALEALRKELKRLTDVGISTGFYADEKDNWNYDDSWTEKDLINAKIDPDKDEFLKKDPELAKILADIKDTKVAAELYLDIKEEKQKAARLDPEKWETFSYWQLHAYFGCTRAFAGKRPIYDAAKWAEIRDYWHQFKKEDEEETPIVEELGPRTYQFTTETAEFALEPFQSGEKGRGLLAARDISKGEMVFKGTNNTIVFTHGHTWRSMLFAFYDERPEEGEPPDAETACDLLVWSWVQPLEEDGPLYIIMDLDDGSLLNEGRDAPGWEKPNVICGKEGDTMCYLTYYATKDIKKGEELLCDYREFAWLDSWADMGL